MARKTQLPTTRKLTPCSQSSTCLTTSSRSRFLQTTSQSLLRRAMLTVAINRRLTWVMETTYVTAPMKTTTPMPTTMDKDQDPAMSRTKTTAPRRPRTNTRTSREATPSTPEVKTRMEVVPMITRTPTLSIPTKTKDFKITAGLQTKIDLVMRHLLTRLLLLKTMLLRHTSTPITKVARMEETNLNSPNSLQTPRTSTISSAT